MTTRKPRNWPSISGSHDERATEAFRRLEDLTRLISDWVWETDTDDVITYTSDRIIDRLGLLPDQVVGRRFGDFGEFTDRLGLQMLPPDFRRPFRDASFRALGHEGQPRFFALSGLPRFSMEDGGFLGVTGVAVDVTDIRLVEHANARLADAIEVLSEYFALYDEEDRLVICNARFRQLNADFPDEVSSGRTFEELLRKQVAAGVYPDANEDAEQWIGQRLRRRNRKQSAEEVLQDGRCYLVEEEGLPDGGTVMMLRDITQIRAAMKTLEERSNSHRDFASSVAHRLRTPLAVVRSNLDSLGDSADVASLKREIDTLARMIEQMLTLTRYEHFNVPTQAMADLRQIAVTVISSLAPIAIRENRSIELKCGEDPVFVNGDAGALEHAVRNIVENAVKYSARGTMVEVEIVPDPASIMVMDQGRGIPLEQRADLFQPFSKIDRRGAGAGLGLNIVKAIAEAHSAEVSIGDRRDGGAIVGLRFPPTQFSQSLPVKAR